MRKTKIVITVGPATQNQQSIEALITKGVDVFRLNFSHGDFETHRRNIRLIRQASQKLGREVAILQDISGPKVRIGKIDGVLKFVVGDYIYLSKEKSDDFHTLELSYPNIIDKVALGDEIFFADGTVRSVVEEKQNDRLKLKLLTDGELTSKKGVNFPHTKLDISAITPKDVEDLAFGAQEGVDIVALSFIQSKEDIKRARAILAEHGKNTVIVSKIEMVEAIANLDEIIAHSDGIMVARGDLGAEVGLSKVPRLQKKIIQKSNEANRFVITATQMLSSMKSSPFPTRAEVSDIANAVYDGTDAVMLSDETTIGQFPLQAVDVLNDVIVDVEEDYPYNNDLKPETTREDVIALSAVKLASHLQKDGLIAFTTSGFTAKSLSKYRPKNRIFAVTHSKEVLRMLNVVWGVTPLFHIPNPATSLELLYRFVQEAKKTELLGDETKFIITLGSIAGRPKTTNVIRTLNKEGVMKIEEEFRQKQHCDTLINEESAPYA